MLDDDVVNDAEGDAIDVAVGDDVVVGDDDVVVAW